MHSSNSFAIFCSVAAENALTATCSLKGSLHMFNLWALIHIWLLQSCKYRDKNFWTDLFPPTSHQQNDMPRNRTLYWFIMLSDHNCLQKKQNGICKLFFVLVAKYNFWKSDSLKPFRFIDQKNYDTREEYANDLINAFCLVSLLEECIFDAMCTWLIL